MFVLLLLACSPKGIDLDTGPACTETAWYVDVDGDGYGGGEAEFACEAPKGGMPDGGDCDDGDPLISPAADESCNGYDDDCDGAVDDDDPMADGSLAWFRDSDGDRHGDKNYMAVACTAPPGYVGTADDCDDDNADVHPGQKDECGDGEDVDCDGRDCVPE